MREVRQCPVRQSRVGLRLEEMDDIGAKGTCATDKRGCEEKVEKSGWRGGEWEILDLHSLFLPAMPGILRVLPGRQEYRYAMSTPHEGLRQGKSTDSHRAARAQSEGADEDKPHA